MWRSVTSFFSNIAADASSLSSSSITNCPCINRSNSAFSTSDFRRLFLMRILRFSWLGDGSGTPGSSCTYHQHYVLNTLTVVCSYKLLQNLILYHHISLLYHQVTLSSTLLNIHVNYQNFLNHSAHPHL